MSDRDKNTYFEEIPKLEYLEPGKVEDFYSDLGRNRWNMIFRTEIKVSESENKENAYEAVMNFLCEKEEVYSVKDVDILDFYSIEIPKGNANMNPNNSRSRINNALKMLAELDLFSATWPSGANMNQDQENQLKYSKEDWKSIREELEQVHEKYRKPEVEGWI